MKPEEVEFQVEWRVPAKNSIYDKEYWTVCASDNGIGSQIKARDLLKWWKETQPEFEFRLVKITRVIIDKQQASPKG